MGWEIRSGIHVSTAGPIPTTGTVTVATAKYIDGRAYPLRPEDLPVDRLAEWHGYSVDMHGDVPLDPRQPLKPTWDIFEDNGTPRYTLELDRIRLQAAGSNLYAEMIALPISDRPIRMGIFGWDTGSPPRIPPPAEIEKALHGLEILGLVRELEAARRRGKQDGDGARHHSDQAFLSDLDDAIQHVQRATGRANPDARRVMQRMNYGKTRFYERVKKTTGKRWRDVAAEYEKSGIKRN